MIILISMGLITKYITNTKCFLKDFHPERSLSALWKHFMTDSYPDKRSPAYLNTTKIGN